MEVIHKFRGSGKTTEAIKRVANYDGYLVVRNGEEVKRAYNLAQAMGVEINMPITFHDLMNKKYYGMGVKHLVIDDLEVLLNSTFSAPVSAVTITKEGSGYGRIVNLQREFDHEIKGRKLICAKIGLSKDYGSSFEWVVLKEDFTEDEFENFREYLNVNYGRSLIFNQVSGLILFENSYSDRRRADGAEWWSNHRKPTVEEVLEYSLGRIN